MPKLTASSRTKQKDYQLFTPETMSAAGYPGGQQFKRLRLTGNGEALESPCVHYLNTGNFLTETSSYITTANGENRVAYRNPPVAVYKNTLGSYEPYRLVSLANFITITTPGYRKTTSGNGYYGTSTSTTYIQKSSWQSIFPLKKDLVIILTSYPGYSNWNYWGPYERFQNCWYAKAGESGGVYTEQETDYDFKKLGSGKEEICAYIYYPTGSTGRFDIGWSWTAGYDDNRWICGPRDAAGNIDSTKRQKVKGPSYSGAITSGEFYFFWYNRWVAGWNAEFSVVQTDYTIYTENPGNNLYGNGHHASGKYGSNHTEICGWRNFAVLNATSTLGKSAVYRQDSLTFMMREP